MSSSSESVSLAELGVPSRRTVLKAGLGLAVGAGVVAASPRVANAAPTATKIRNLSGPAETGPFAAPWSDLGIPALCPNGSMLYVGGDTFDGDGVGGPDWRAPVGLRSSSSNLSSLRIDGSVGGSHANGLVPEGHVPVNGGHTTAIPSDVFTIGNTMYMHLMRGVIYQTDHTDFWKSTDNGEPLAVPVPVAGQPVQQPVPAEDLRGSQRRLLLRAVDHLQSQCRVGPVAAPSIAEPGRHPRLIPAVGLRQRCLGLGELPDVDFGFAPVGRDLLPRRGR